MPVENARYKPVIFENDLRHCKVVWNSGHTGSKRRPKKEDMEDDTVYLYYSDEVPGPCYAVRNKQGVIQRGQLRFALDQSKDIHNIGKLLANKLSLHILTNKQSKDAERTSYVNYKNSYLFIDNKTLIYVDQNGDRRECPINTDEFKIKLKNANPNNLDKIQLDSEKIQYLITPNIDVFKVIQQSVQFADSAFKTLEDDYRFLLEDFKAELKIRHAYNCTQVRNKRLTQELCNEFKEDADAFLKSIEDAVTPDFHQPSWLTHISRSGLDLSKKDPTGEKKILINQALMRGRMALEVPHTENERRLYVENLREMKTLSNEISGHSDARMKKIGICLVLFAAFSLGMAFAAPTFGASLFLSAAAAATMASIMTIAMPISGSFMGMIGLGCVISGIEKGPASGLSNFKETAEEVFTRRSSRT